MKKGKIILIISALVLLAILIFVYNTFLSTTTIGFVNYRAIELGAIGKANNNSFIKILDIPVDELEKVSDCDMIFINGMGLRIVEEQRKFLEKIANEGTPTLTSMATNPANNISNIDPYTKEILNAYLAGGKKNYRNLLNYVRNDVDIKFMSNYDVEEPIERSFDILYHPPLTENSDEELEFQSVAEYEKFLKKK